MVQTAGAPDDDHAIWLQTVGSEASVNRTHQHAVQSAVLFSKQTRQYRFLRRRHIEDSSTVGVAVENMAMSLYERHSTSTGPTGRRFVLLYDVGKALVHEVTSLVPRELPAVCPRDLILELHASQLFRTVYLLGHVSRVHHLTSYPAQPLPLCTSFTQCLHFCSASSSF